MQQFYKDVNTGSLFKPLSIPRTIN